MTTNNQELRPGEEDALKGLLREMAPETEPPPEVRERIRQAVAAEWRAAVVPVSRPVPQPATRGWQWPGLALAASLAAAAIALGVFQFRTPTPAPVMATLTRLSGPVETGAGAGWQPVNTGQALSVGQQLVTGPRGKAALTLARGVTLRLDTDTRIALAGIDRVIVERGAVYLDSGDRPAVGAGLRIDSSFGSTRHLGTQYEVRVAPERMLVSVREGQVETASGTLLQTHVVAQAGEQLAIGTTGAITRRAVDRRDPRWNWITDVTPPYGIEDRRLSEFLAWVCRETGRELVFASPQAKAAAEQVILRGSIAGLSPDDALAAVMATTNLAYSDDNGRLTIQSPVRQAATR